MGIEERPEERPEVQLASGKYFDLIYLNVEDVSITDIAISLSKLCRYNGHCKGLYSVAQHCCLMAHHAPIHEKWNTLMHDCAEAIIGDITRPVKYFIPGIKELETKIEIPLFARFMVRESALVKQLDQIATVTERRDLMHPNGNWRFVEGVKPWKETITVWEPEYAEERFLKMAAELMPSNCPAMAA